MNNDVLKKASLGRGLSLDETKELFNLVTNSDELGRAKNIAEIVRKKIIGTKTSLYTCLYVTNQCVNNCPYCGFKTSNRNLKRVSLTLEQVGGEAKAIKEMGIKNVILIGGTVPEKNYKNLILSSTELLVRDGFNVWIEFENLSQGTLTELHKIGAKRFVLFQETYDDALFRKIHSRNMFKNDPVARRQEISNAIEAGFQEVGIGALFGLSTNYFCEIAGLYQHAKQLLARGIKVSTSIPKITPAHGVDSVWFNNVSDFLVEKITVVLRLAIPEVSLAVSGRESSTLRDELFGIINEVGSGGIAIPGGRTVFKNNYKKKDKQFSLADERSPKEIKKVIIIKGFFS